MLERTTAPLRRSLRRIGTLLLTLSGITPAASVFVMGQSVIGQAGSGALLAFAAAAFLGLTTAYVYAELGSAFPLTGGEYSMMGRTLGGCFGMMALWLNLFGGALGQAVLALGLADYLKAVIPEIAPIPAALAVTLGTTIVTLLNVRLNAVVTGAFLAVELFAIGVMTWLGAVHPHQSLPTLIVHPLVVASRGLAPASWPAIGTATAGAIFVFNGYGGAVFFGEEMYEAHSRMAWVVFWSLGIAVVAEMAPVAAALCGASDLKTMLASPEPLQAFLLGAGGPFVHKAVSVGVALAIVNAMIAIGLINARQLYCSARDGVWPTAWNGVIAAVHPRFHSPWVATLIMGGATAACCFLDLDLLVVLTGAGLILVYVGVSLAAIVGRMNQTSAHASYRMPLFPVWPALSLADLAAVVWANLFDPDVGRPSLIANLAVVAASAAYYFFYLRKRGGWILRDADGQPLATPAAAGLGERTTHAI